MIDNQLDNREEISELTLRYLSSINNILPTKSILDLEKRIKTWIKIGATGGCVWGRPRLGKSFSISYISNSINDKYGEDFPIIRWNITDHPATEKNFYSSLLMAMGFACPKSATALILKERVLNQMIINAYDTTYKKVVMFIDEAWKLYENDFSWLMDLYNNLNEKNIQLSVFLFGTRELKDLKTELKSRGKDQIIGRFLINEVQFYGITSKEELLFCLMSLDTIKMRSSLDQELEETLLDFYFPYADGLTFSSICDDFWDAFMEIRVEHNIIAADIPMKYLMDSFIICLDTYGVLGDETISFPTKKELKECVRLSGYGESDDEYENKKKRKR